jgi:hypothetical protein
MGGDYQFQVIQFADARIHKTQAGVPPSVRKGSAFPSRLNQFLFMRLSLRKGRNKACR